MRSFLAAALSLVSALALPIPPRAMSTTIEFQVLEYNSDNGYTKFRAPIGQDDDALVFDLQVRPSSDATSSNITLNSELLDITWITSPDSTQLVARHASQSLTVPDTLGFPHLVHILIAGEVAAAPGFPSAYDNVQTIDLTIDSVDGVACSTSGFSVIANPTALRRLVKLVTLYEGATINFDQYNKSFMSDKWESDATTSDTFTSHSNDSQEPLDIEAEIETLLLLELEAGELHTAITNKKEAIAKCLKDHRDQVTLRHLLQQCDGLVCAAKVIAQRMCDKIGILTVPKVGYAKVQNPSSQKLIELDDDINEKLTDSNVAAAAIYTNTTRTASLSSAAIQPIQVIYPQNALIKALGAVAGLLGLSALFSFIRRKCMSMRKRVEREADREERKNARAYRRAARRADMRRRWEAFVKALSCFQGEEEPTIKDYEEKRALILQDAMLEQDAATAEKSEIMDAEIRELRHAHEIVASLVQVHDHRFSIITPISDPPPPLVPLPFTPVSRSRASTMTLPSYHSESLPDYTSRYQQTETGSHSSGNSSVRSSSVRSSSVRSNSVVLSSRANSIIIDGLLYIPNTSEDGTFTGHTTRSFSPQSLAGGSSDGSRISRFTPTSSIIEMSPRASEETLRFSWRRSVDTMGGFGRSEDARRSWDTNDL
ncbi:hypothetical protein DOTSEDRAFT_69203 [Dothistroma septosporum NZE10]|uniref:Uncharacterized protein n=1 Tax=Dothistroma septosporum (strain NZE10 / CBS 128990) TaxID=675120 RepID=N1PXP2_DOTSN|nr:hypothetical protein DOTSEDRAFT_69203 [Dothistroma septosporum NZE10]